MKKVLAIALALCMILALCAITASADGELIGVSMPTKDLQRVKDITLMTVLPSADALIAQKLRTMQRASASARTFFIWNFLLK